MRWLSILLLCLAAATTFFAAFSPDRDLEPADEQAVQIEKQVYLFEAKYFKTKGPCIGNHEKGWDMPAVDAFEVTAKLEGDLAASWIQVRCPSPHGPGYPKDLTKGKVYRFQLTPSARTKEQLRENVIQGHSMIAVDGDEIEERPPGK